MKNFNLFVRWIKLRFKILEIIEPVGHCVSGRRESLVGLSCMQRGSNLQHGIASGLALSNVRAVNEDGLLLLL